VCVLEELSNATNLGAVFRSAAALGVEAVLLAPTCGDPLYRRSVRVSMGEVFALPYARVGQWPDGLEQLRDRGFRLLALTPDAAATSLDTLVPDEDDRLAVLLGAEGPGLSESVLDIADLLVRIPMAADVDSLNVAAAAAVAFWVVGRR
jgi:tRNA G18 (ribose-2'-O)-methylase SpoU